MIFVFGKWDGFCRKLQEKGLQSIPACEVKPETKNYLVLKHDVETNVARAYTMAEIEAKYAHRGTYYVQAYLLEDAGNIELLRKMQHMGHEISYHYDVMDSCKGVLSAAIDEFEKNRRLFEENGFPIVTVCQHGNPIVERVGYHSNRDFFRSSRVQALYPGISDIMVNYKDKIPTRYSYFSDAGRMFKRIYDPINNDIVNSDDKNVPYADLNELLTGLRTDEGNFISTHPHRWTSSAVLYMVKSGIFKAVKAVAKVLVRIPVFKKFMSKFYFLAKKF